VIAFDESDVRALLQDLEADRDIELLSKTAITEQGVPHSMLAPVDRLFEDLTDRQLAALQLALEQGYYEQPRGTSLRELASRTSIARSTYEEHLRKAENKLMANAGTYLRLVTSGTAANPLGVDRSGQPEQHAD